MAKAKKLPSGSWRCLVYDYTDSTGKRHYESFTCDDPSPKGKRRCEAMAAEFADKKERRNKSSYNILFKDALDIYISERNAILSPATIRKYRGMQKSLSALGDMKLKDINQGTLQAYINQLSITKKPKTVKDTYGLINAVVRRFCHGEVLQIALPRNTRIDRKMPTEGEIRALIECVVGTNMEVPVYLAAFAMMRRGEIAALRKDDISGNVIHVSKTMVLTVDNEWVIKSPKSYAGDRYVPVPQFVVDAFMALPGDGVGMTPNIITSSFEHVLKRAGIQHFRFHDLRHYSASVQHALGIPDAYIMQAGGWGNDRVLKDIYRHTLEDARQKMSNVAISYFESMQHDMQHEKKKAP